MGTAIQNGASANGHHSNGGAPELDSENPLHRLTPEQIEAIGREFDELHEQVKADLAQNFPGSEIRSTEAVGSTVSDELFIDGMEALGFAPAGSFLATTDGRAFGIWVRPESAG